MFYTISVKLTQDSKDIRNFLKQHGFQIYYYDAITGSFFNDSDSYHKNNNEWIRYQCIYNSPAPPQQRVLQRLISEHESVLNLSITIQ